MHRGAENFSQTHLFCKFVSTPSSTCKRRVLSCFWVTLNICFLGNLPWCHLILHSSYLAPSLVPIQMGRSALGSVVESGVNFTKQLLWTSAGARQFKCFAFEQEQRWHGSFTSCLHCKVTVLAWNESLAWILMSVCKTWWHSEGVCTWLNVIDISIKSLVWIVFCGHVMRTGFCKEAEGRTTPCIHHVLSKEKVQIIKVCFKPLTIELLLVNLVLRSFYMVPILFLELRPIPAVFSRFIIVFLHLWIVCMNFLPFQFWCSLVESPYQNGLFISRANCCPFSMMFSVHFIEENSDRKVNHGRMFGTQ